MKIRKKTENEKTDASAVRSVSLKIAEDDENKRLFRLKKQKNAIKREKQSREERSLKEFERRRKSASDKKAPLTLRTRGYYRFSRDYPAVVDDNRFRENIQYSKKSRIRLTVTAVLMCILAFCVGFIPATTAIFISSAPSDGKIRAPQQNTERRLSMKAICITYDELRKGSADEIINKLKANDCDTAVFEFKDDNGYCIFNTGSFIGTSADKRIPDAYNTMRSVKSAGYRTAAYISCFLDTCAAVSDYTFAVRSGTAEGGAWRDNSSHCWLNPYSKQANDYILSVIKAAADGGFSRILLGNVRFPTDSGETEAFFEGEATSHNDRNTTLRAFIASAVSAAGNASVSVICDLNAVNTSTENKLGGTQGSLIGTAAGSVCVDARASVTPSVIVVGEKKITGASSMPYVLVSEITKYTVKNIESFGVGKETKKDELFVFIDGKGSAREEKEALLLGGADGFIIR